VRNLIASLLAAAFGYRHRNQVLLGNIAEGTHEDSITKLADAAQTTRHLLVKIGTDADHIAVCGASNDPLGVCNDEPSAAEREANVILLGVTHNTVLMVASEAIPAGERVYTAASGKVQDEPSAAGTYYCVGRALTAAGDDGDVIEVEPCFPIGLVVPA